MFLRTLFRTRGKTHIARAHKPLYAWTCTPNTRARTLANASMLAQTHTLEQTHAITCKRTHLRTDLRQRAQTHVHGRADARTRAQIYEHARRRAKNPRTGAQTLALARLHARTLLVIVNFQISETRREN